jgi:hypothetical protein
MELAERFFLLRTYNDPTTEDNCREQAISRFDRWSVSAMAMLRQLPNS